MKFFAKIIIFLLLLSGCSSSRPQMGKTPKEIRKINNRRELRALQYARWQRVEKAKAVAEAEQRRIAKAMPKEMKQKKEEEKRAAQAIKEGKKRHLKWQSEETKKRMKQSKKEAEKRMKN